MRPSTWIGIIVCFLMALLIVKVAHGQMMGELSKVTPAPIPWKDVKVVQPVYVKTLPMFSIYAASTGNLLFSHVYDIQCDSVFGISFIQDGQKRYCGVDVYIEPEPPHGRMFGPRK